MGAKKLTPEDRDEIARLHAQSYSVSEIARKLGRSKSTISSELNAGMWYDHNRHIVVYVANHAQRLSEQRRSKSHQHSSLDYTPLKAYVEQHIRTGWSPEQICGRIRKDHPNDPKMRISHETIYGYIYADEQANEKLWEYLPRKQKKRKKRTGRKVHRSRIPDRVSIHERPETVTARDEFGHYEGDSVEGKRSVGDGIRTEVERVSRKLFARKISRIASADTLRAQLKIFRSIPTQARRSSTQDNGRENYLHAQLTRQLGIAIYFADPYSSWQRGTNEYTNGLLRRYLPKRTDFTTLTQAELNDIVEEINNRPRKCLDYDTPNEVFSRELERIKRTR